MIFRVNKRLFDTVSLFWHFLTTLACEQVLCLGKRWKNREEREGKGHSIPSLSSRFFHPIPKQRACSQASDRDHPKCKAKWSPTEGDRLQESNHRGPLRRRGPGASTLWKIICCMQCLSYHMYSSMLSLKFFAYILSSIVHTASL